MNLYYILTDEYELTPFCEADLIASTRKDWQFDHDAPYIEVT